MQDLKWRDIMCQFNKRNQFLTCIKAVNSTDIKEKIVD